MRPLLLRGNAYGRITARSGATLLPAQVELVNADAVAVRLTPDGAVVKSRCTRARNAWCSVNRPLRASAGSRK
jgi:hypothetical protein